MGKTIIQRPIWHYYLLISGIIGGIAGIVVLIVSLVYLAFTATWLEITIGLGIWSVLFLILFAIVFRLADNRFVNVKPSIAHFHKFEEGPWLHWSSDPKTTITVNWFTPEKCKTVIAWKPVSNENNSE
jgi:hypothetical protein